MRIVAQRAASGSVRWEEDGAQRVATIGPGLVLLVGAAPSDDETTVRRMADKLVDLRVFGDEAGRMNL
ncbi:MAG: D-tyrosyl-tRNA(Tyr) deacylase, partial [Chloroflexi bacterium]